jgi:hypothetical protein
MSAQDYLHPEQFGQMRSSLLGKTLPEVAKHHYKNSPEYMRALERDVKRNGFQHPIAVSEEDPTDITGGHHRAAVAYKLGIPVPVRPEGDWEFSEEHKVDTDKWHDRLVDIQMKNVGY